MMRPAWQQNIDSTGFSVSHMDKARPGQAKAGRQDMSLDCSA